jgi:hypothetical protein
VTKNKGVSTQLVTVIKAKDIIKKIPKNRARNVHKMTCPIKGKSLFYISLQKTSNPIILFKKLVIVKALPL